MNYRIETNHIDIWKIINNANNYLIIDFDNERELLIWLRNYHVYEGKKRAIEVLINLSNNYKGENYSTWLDSLTHSKTWGELYKTIDDKLEELTLVI